MTGVLAFMLSKSMHISLVMIGNDLEITRVMVAKEDGTIFVATDEYLANNRPLWQSVMNRALLKRNA